MCSQLLRVHGDLRNTAGKADHSRQRARRFPPNVLESPGKSWKIPKFGCRALGPEWAGLWISGVLTVTGLRVERGEGGRSAVPAVGPAFTAWLPQAASGGFSRALTPSTPPPAAGSALRPVSLAESQLLCMCPLLGSARSVGGVG